MGEAIWTPVPYGRRWALEWRGDFVRDKSGADVMTYGTRKNALAAARARLPAGPAVTDRDIWLKDNGPAILEVLELCTPWVGTISVNVDRDIGRIEQIREMFTRYARQLELREIGA